MRDVVASFASELAPDSRLGVVLFDEKVHLAMGLTGASAPGFKERVTESLKRIDYRGRRTQLPAGVERGIYELRQLGRPGAKRIIIFLTDGIVDVGSPAANLEQARWLREGLAQEAKTFGIRVFGIAFTEAADYQLIQSVAQTTGGEYYRVFADSEIASTFKNIGERLETIDHADQSARHNPASAATVERTGWGPWPVVAVGLVVLGMIAVVALRVTRRSAPDVRMPVAMLSELGLNSAESINPLKKVVTHIGRNEKTNDIVIPHDTVSSQQATIEFREGSFYLRDLRSSNGTFLNGKRFSDPEATKEVILKHGDRIRFDVYEFEFLLAALESVDATRVADAPGGGTRLRADPSVGSVGMPKMAPTPAAGLVVHGRDQEEPQTRLKPGKCPQHEMWNATELCPRCKTAYCKNCMRAKDGQMICAACAEAA
jgi:hypothetical protein